jgi:DNA-binding transcriptional LysR family regulator
MELRHIRYFLAVAAEGNFSRAATRVGIGQPPLSLQIKDLETEIGARLFYRVPHGAELTDAGRAFLERVSSIPDCAAEAVRAAQRAARGETGCLAVGFTASAALNPIVPKSIRSFRRAFPEVELRLEEANSVALVAGLIEGRLDAAILRPSQSGPGELQFQRLADEALVVALPGTHVFAGEPGEIDLGALKNEPLILTPRTVVTGLHDAALSACRAAGFEPKLGQPAPQIVSILSLVSAELGFSLVPDSMRQLQVNGVVYRAIRSPVPTVGVAIGHKSLRPSRLAVNFAATTRAIAKDLE